MRIHSIPKINKAMLCAALFGALPFTLSACQREVNPFDYVSEYRSNLFLYSSETVSVRAQEVDKEYPYIADGFCGTLTKRLEVFLSPAQGTDGCSLSFFYGGKAYGGEASFDSVKGEYYYSCTVERSDEHSVEMTVTLGDVAQEITLRSVLDSNTLTGKAVLEKLEEAEPNVFLALTDKNGFAGEIYLRLLYEDAPFYYVGVVDRQGNVNAYLLNAQTGKLLAKRSS